MSDELPDRLSGPKQPWAEAPLLTQLTTMGPRGCCTDLDFDRVLTGEANAEQTTQLKAHLSSSPACAARFVAYEQEAAQWSAAPPSLAAISSTSSSPPSSSPPPSLAKVIALSSRRAVRFAAGMGAAAAAAVVVLAVWPPTIPEPDADIRERTKGLGVVAQFGALDGSDLFDGDGLPSSATVRVDVRSKSDGVAVLSASNDGAHWQPLTPPTAVQAEQTARLVSSSSLSAQVRQLRVLVCDTEAATAAFDASGSLAADHPQRPLCVVDGIGVKVAP
jgi:hypothetical protein